MALPSQMPRTTRQASFRAPSSRRGSLPRSIALAGLIVAGGFGVWWLWDAQRDGAAPAEVASDTSASPINENISLTLENRPGPSGTLASDRRQPLSGGPGGAASHLPIDVRPASTPIPPAPEPTKTAASTTPQTNPPASAAQVPDVASPPSVATAPVEPPIQPRPQPVAPTRDPALQRLIAGGEAAVAQSKQVEARALYNRALHHPRAGEADVAWLKQELTKINSTLVFSTAVTTGDTLVDTYVVQPGDSLVRITQSAALGVEWRFIQRINQMSDPGKLRVGQKLKLVKGPFHAIVQKSAYRLDLYADQTDAEGNKLYIRSFAVGLGEHNSTPTGRWVVRSASKLVNPHWVNPRTGEKFSADDPKNPIGEFWLGLTGTDANTEVLSGYGIHGTIEPDSIGNDASMGCIRMLENDIALIYEMLVEGKSEVEIVP